MKKLLLTAIAGFLPALLMAQSAIDAYQLSRNDFAGTARFMSMGGAFGARGGDLSTLKQNPAGIGVYRSSEIGVTLDIDMQSSNSVAMGYGNKESQTKAYCNNFGYIGTINTGSEVMPTFSWGASFSRAVSFDRVYSGYSPSISTSLSNYIAGFSGGYSPEELLQTSDNNPYLNSDCDWLSILAYNSYMINPSGDSDQYEGLYQSGTSGDASYFVREQGYVDEYSINFGGNFANTLYWGVGFGITDLEYTNETYYDESLADARIVDAEAVGTETGEAYTGIDNYKHISGTGFNFKVGLIYKPINELRIGFAVHTPTYYNLSHYYDAYTDFYYESGYDTDLDNDFYNYTSYAAFESKLNTPWRFIASVAGVIGEKGILSFDYERVAYNAMKVKDRTGVKYEDLAEDINNYYQASNIFRIGAEYRITPSLSVRAGYNCQLSAVKDDAANDRAQIYTSGTNPSYAFDDTDQYITCGLGCRLGRFYIDAAYVHEIRKSTFHAFTPFEGNSSPEWKLTDNNNSLVFSIGYKF